MYSKISGSNTWKDIIRLNTNYITSILKDAWDFKSLEWRLGECS